MKETKQRRIGVREADELINNLDLQPILHSRKRRARWLYNNGNRLAWVYPELLVRQIVNKFSQRINELEKEIEKLKNKQHETNKI